MCACVWVISSLIQAWACFWVLHLSLRCDFMCKLKLYNLRAMNTFFVGCFCCQGCHCWQGCWKGQWVAKCFEYSFGHCLGCMHNTRTIPMYICTCMYVNVCVCVCVLTVRVCHAVSQQKTFENRICTIYALLCLSLKARDFGFYSTRTTTTTFTNLIFAIFSNFTH